MANLTQSDRLMQFSSPVLHKDALLIESFEGTEGISSLFAFKALLVAPAGTKIDPVALVGAKATVAIGLNDVMGTRWFNGLIASFDRWSNDDEFDGYKAYLVPSMWLLTLSTNCRVFQNLSVMEIVKQVLGEYSLSLEDHTNGTYKVLDYCTQYNESDFAFVSRILEQHGIFYWFEHSDQDNKVMFGDDRDTYSDCPLSASVAYALEGHGAEGGYGAQLTMFGAKASMVPGVHATREYDFHLAGTHQTQNEESTSVYGKNAFEDRFYPAGEEGYVKNEKKDLSDPAFRAMVVKAQKLAADMASEVFRGKSNLRSAVSGYTFNVTKHPRKEWNRKYLLTKVVHKAGQSPPYRAIDKAIYSEGYTNTLMAVSSDIVYKPAAVTPKPRIYGPQTAVVVAPSGDDMSVDKLGRVCVQFFWTRGREPNTMDNTWVRVAQPWAGNGWGMFFWPRMNDEVVVQFLNGDPDNPVVTGSVYNGVNLPKYAPPDHITRTGIVTRSSKGGSAQNANELRFEDLKGSEQIYLHAEKDMDLTVEFDQRRSVGGNDSLTVTGAQMEKIGGNSSLTIGGDLAESVGGNADLKIGGNQTEAVGSNFSLNVGANHNHKVGSNYAVSSGQNVYLNGGMNVVIEAGVQLTLSAAGGFITIGPAGVAISGTMVLINSGGAAGSGTPPQVPSPASPTAPDTPDDGTKGTKM